MIADAYVTHWSTGAPWPTRTQIEQDLLLTTALTDLGNRLGFEVRTQLAANPKVYFRAVSAEGGRMRFKVEVNCTFRRTWPETVFDDSAEQSTTRIMESEIAR